MVTIQDAMLAMLPKRRGRMILHPLDGALVRYHEGNVVGASDPHKSSKKLRQLRSQG